MREIELYLRYNISVLSQENVYSNFFFYSELKY